VNNKQEAREPQDEQELQDAAQNEKKQIQEEF